MSTVEQTVRKAQERLRGQFGALVVDGKWGHATQDAFDRATHDVRVDVIRIVADNGHSLNDIQREAEKRAVSPANGGAVKRPITPFASMQGAIMRTSEQAIRAVKRAFTSPEQVFKTAVEQAGLRPEEVAMLMAQVRAESNFQPVRESHRYSLRFKNDFSALRGLTDAEYLALQSQGPEAFFEAVYGWQTKKGRELGNTSPGDGFLYRGGGYKQLTGKANYIRYGKLAGVDLVSNPRAIEDPAISAKVAAAYWIDRVRGKGNLTDVRLVTKAFAGQNAVDTAVVRLPLREQYSKEYLSMLA